MSNGAWSGFFGMALAIGMVGSVMVWVFVSNARQARERQELATRRGWDLHLKPAPKTPWQLSGDGLWLLVAQESGSGEDTTTTYTWTTTQRHAFSGRIQIQHREVAKWMESSGGKGAMKLAAKLSQVLGAGASFEERMKEFAAQEFADFSRPDLAEYRLISQEISSRQALEVLGDEAQIAFLKWRAALPSHQTKSVNLKIELERGAIRVETTDSLDGAAALEAFVDFCAALKR